MTTTIEMHRLKDAEVRGIKSNIVVAQERAAAQRSTLTLASLNQPGILEVPFYSRAGKNDLIMDAPKLPIEIYYQALKAVDGKLVGLRDRNISMTLEDYLDHLNNVGDSSFVNFEYQKQVSSGLVVIKNSTNIGGWTTWFAYKGVNR